MSGNTNNILGNISIFGNNRIFGNTNIIPIHFGIAKYAYRYYKVLLGFGTCYWVGNNAIVHYCNFLYIDMVLVWYGGPTIAIMILVVFGGCLGFTCMGFICTCVAGHRLLDTIRTE